MLEVSSRLAHVCALPQLTGLQIGGDYLTWEGQQQNIYFPDSGVTVQTHIDSDAQSRGFGDYAGYAYRPADGKTFNCYKVLGTDSEY